MTILNLRFTELADLIPLFEIKAGPKIVEAASLIIEAFRNNNKVLICGNGGSAADSQHFAAEFVKIYIESHSLRSR